MSDLPDDIDEKAIREAPTEKINRWVALFRGIEVFEGDNTVQWSWGDELPDVSRSLNYRHMPEPPPYTSEWWAAGPLLEEVSTPLSPPTHTPRPGKWAIDGATEEDVYAEGDTAPEAIARAYLLAAHRGLLEGENE